MYATGFVIVDDFVTAEHPHNAFFVTAPHGGWSAHVTVGNFISNGLKEELSSAAATCWLVDEALPLAARTLETNGTCALQPGLRAVTNSKAAFQCLQLEADQLGIDVARFALRTEAEAAECLRSIAAVFDQDLLALDIAAGRPFENAYRRIFPSDTSLGQDKIEVLPTVVQVSGDWLDPPDFHFALDASFFVLGDNPGESVGTRVTVTGPARILFGGPYVFLPKGLVQCEFNLELSHELDNESFQINVYSGSNFLISRSFHAPALAILGLRFRFDNPCNHTPIDIHFLNLTGAIAGEVRLYKASFGSCDLPS
jgi:hypothetical protein